MDSKLSEQLAFLKSILENALSYKIKYSQWLLQFTDVSKA